MNAFSEPDVFQVVVKIGESTYLFGAGREMLAIAFDNVENETRILQVAVCSKLIIRALARIVRRGSGRFVPKDIRAEVFYLTFAATYVQAAGWLHIKKIHWDLCLYDAGDHGGRSGHRYEREGG